VFEKDVMTVYRLCLSVGRYHLVGTTIKTSALPADVAADEKHTHLAGEKVYVATTVADGCFLGASISPTADEAHLTAAYQQFHHEAHQIQPAYQPKTVNTAGWQATMKAWRTLFPQIILIHWFFTCRIEPQTGGDEGHACALSGDDGTRLARLSSDDQSELCAAASATA
jgi:hypothetical protein